MFLQLGILFDCAEEIALALVGQRAKALAVADTFQRKTVLFQSGADGVEVVGVLVELLVEVLPRLAVVDVHADLHPAVGGAVMVAPDAGGVLFFKRKDVFAQHVLVLIGRVHIEQEHAALFHKETGVGDGFEKVANGVNDYMRSDKPRTFLQKLGDTLVMVVGWLLKICLVIFAIICSPILFVFGVVFVALLFAAIAVAVGGGAALISFFPMADVVLPTSPLSAIVMYIAGILLVGIPLVSLVWAIFSQIFKWQPMNSGLKWTLVILWIVSAACFGICFAVQGATFPELGIFNF